MAVSLEGEERSASRLPRPGFAWATNYPQGGLTVAPSPLLAEVALDSLLVASTSSARLREARMLVLSKA